AAAPDLAQEAILAQLGRDAPGLGVLGEDRAGQVAALRGQLFHHQQGGEEVADVVGQVGVAGAVLLDGGLFAPAAALGELLGEALDGVAVQARGRHGCLSPAGPVGPASIPLRARKARMYSWLAWAAPRVRTAAVSALLSRSKWRRA